MMRYESKSKRIFNRKSLANYFACRFNSHSFQLPTTNLKPTNDLSIIASIVTYPQHPTINFHIAEKRQLHDKQIYLKPKVALTLFNSWINKVYNMAMIKLSHNKGPFKLWQFQFCTQIKKSYLCFDTVHCGKRRLLRLVSISLKKHF